MRRLAPARIQPWLEELHPRTYGWALVCCGRNADRAAEVLQTSYARILAGGGRFGSIDELRAFLFGVIRRVAQEASRSTRRDADLRANMIRDGLGSESTAPSPEDVAESEEVHGALRRAVSALPQRQREVLHLVFYQELSIRDAAAVLGIGVGSARQHYARGKSALRDHCAPYVRETT